MSYFECNLPKQLPLCYEPELYRALKKCVDRIRNRHMVLDTACGIAEARGVRPADFHSAAKKLFDAIGPERFDSYNCEDIDAAIDLLQTNEQTQDRLDWPNAVVLFDTAFTTTKEWELLRHIGIGGSDASVVLGLSKFRSLEGLYLDKVGAPELVSDAGKAVVFARGHFLEDHLIDAYCKMTGCTRIPETRMFANKRYPAVTANPDAVLRTVSGGIVLFEAKSSTDTYVKVAEWLGYNAPPYYLVQTHQYIGTLDDDRIEGCVLAMLPCTDFELAGIYLGSEYDSSRIFHKFVERDRARETEIFEAETAFWNNHVLARVRPERSGNAAVDEAVALAYNPSPISNPEAPDIELSPTLLSTLTQIRSVDESLRELKAQIKTLENTRDEMRLQVTEQMGAAQVGTLKDVSGNVLAQVKNTLSTRETVDSKLLKNKYPEIFEEVKKVSVSTKFSLKM